MIPDFNELGNLPPGIFNVSLDDVIQRFRVPRSIRRKDLTVNLVSFIRFVEQFAIIVYVDGSYITSKLSPDDIDLLVILPDDFDFDSSEARRLKGYIFDKKNRLDIYALCQTCHRRKIQEYLELFTHDREFNQKGIIIIEMKND